MDYTLYRHHLPSDVRGFGVSNPTDTARKKLINLDLELE